MADISHRFEKLLPTSDFSDDDCTKHAGSLKEISNEMAASDVEILTSGGLHIPAHSTILASASVVLKNIIDRPRTHRRSEGVIPILGVPCEAVTAFVRFIYSRRFTENELEKYGIHLLAISHVFLIPLLKQRCTKGLIEQMTVETVVDVLQLARLCDAPDLYVKCLKYVSAHFKAVKMTEGWKFLQNNDPWLELEILKFMDETKSRKRKTRKQREERSIYLHLSEAMECLEHICKEGCTKVSPYDVAAAKNRRPCSMYMTCHGLQILIKHFGGCKKRVSGGCSRCKRMWQLFRLHSSICDQPETCKVPLCRQLKVKMEEKTKGEDARWGILVRNVLSAKTISSLIVDKPRI